MKNAIVAFAALVMAVTVACRDEQATEIPAGAETTADSRLLELQTLTRRFAPVELTADLSTLPDSERRVLAKLVEAAKIFDALFLRQVWSGNEAMLMDLVPDESPLGRARLRYFLINKGPWSRLDDD